MSDIEKVVNKCKELEAALTSRGATGNGLGEKAASLSNSLSKPLVNKLGYLARARNKLLHEGGDKLDDPAHFHRTASEALNELKPGRSKRSRAGRKSSSATSSGYALAGELWGTIGGLFFCLFLYYLYYTVVESATKHGLWAIMWLVLGIIVIGISERFKGNE
jgi:hypothetical protein